MRTYFRLIFILGILSLSSHLRAQDRKDELLSEVRLRVIEILGEDWFLQPVPSGFDVYFCRSCNEKYKQWLKDRIYLQEGFILPDKERNDFFSHELADSVSYYTFIGSAIHPFDIDSATRGKINREDYQKNGILKFEVRIEPKWSEEKIKQTETDNNLLKQAILEKPLYKTSSFLFSDYRFWLPDKSFRDRTQAYNFYFERLPYQSCWYDFSIFIVSDKPNFFYMVLYADPADARYYINPENFIEEERCRTLKAIAFVLGINDFKVLN